MLTDFYNIWHTVYWVNVQRSLTIIYLSTSPTYSCYNALGNIGCDSKGLAGKVTRVDAQPYICLLYTSDAADE